MVFHDKSLLERFENCLFENFIRLKLGKLARWDLKQEVVDEGRPDLRG